MALSGAVQLTSFLGRLVLRLIHELGAPNGFARRLKRPSQLGEPKL